MVLVYESTLEELRREGHQWWVVVILLHEEIHSAIHVAAGYPPPYADDDTITPLVEELCVSLASNVAELLLLDRCPPTRRRLRRWNEVSYQGARLNALLGALPGDEPDEIVAAAAELAVAVVAAGGRDAVLELLVARSRRSAASWRRILEEL